MLRFDCGTRRVREDETSSSDSYQFGETLLTSLLQSLERYQSQYANVVNESKNENGENEFTQGLDCNALDTEESEEKQAHLVIDHLFREASESKKIFALIFAGRHRKAHLMVLAIQLTLKGKKNQNRWF